MTTVSPDDGGEPTQSGEKREEGGEGEWGRGRKKKMWEGRRERGVGEEERGNDGEGESPALN